MSAKNRYLVATRLSPDAGAPLNEMLTPESLPPGALIRSQGSGGAVLELTPEQATGLLVAGQGGLMVEEDQPLELLMPMPGVGVQVSETGGRTLEFRVVDAETGKSVGGATILGKGIHATYGVEAGKDGRGVLRVFEPALEHVLISPAANYWSKVVPEPSSRGPTEIALPPLRADGEAAWPRSLLGLRPSEKAFEGQGIKVGVIDSGVSAHPDLAPRRGMNCLAGGEPSGFDTDEKGHGTHCAGIIAGRGKESGIRGVAPEAELHSVKVFPGGKLSDFVEALQWCLDQAMDVVQIGVGFRFPSEIVSSKLAELAERGIVCVAAAGNDAGPVLFPAAIPGVIGVSAIGYSAGFPPESAHSLRLSELYNADSGLFFANFSNHGPGVAFCGPGVAIVSCVPGGYVAWDGTSAASAFVSGIAALILQAYPELKTGDYRQALGVREYLEASATDLDLPTELQGAGLPNVERALSDTYWRQIAARRVGESHAEVARNVRSLRASLKAQRKEIQELIGSLR